MMDTNPITTNMEPPELRVYEVLNEGDGASILGDAQADLEDAGIVPMGAVALSEGLLVACTLPNPEAPDVPGERLPNPPRLNFLLGCLLQFKLGSFGYVDAPTVIRNHRNLRTKTDRNVGVYPIPDQEEYAALRDATPVVIIVSFFDDGRTILYTEAEAQE